MGNWSLKSYNGRDIETKEDIKWVCKEVVKAYRTGSPALKDQMALAFLEIYVKEYGDIDLDVPIENRFEILDL